MRIVYMLQTVYEGMYYDQYLYLMTAGQIGEPNEEATSIFNQYQKYLKKEVKVRI